MQILRNIRVLDWSEGIAGPLACQMLGDMGADVIKIERPQGDWGRGMGPGDKEGSTHFHALNRNKRNICIDVKETDGLNIINSLIESADVLITNYRPGIMEKLGFSFKEMRSINPNIIYGRVSGYGYKGELAKLPGSDTILQAVSGIMNQVGDPSGAPYRVGVQIVDHTAARDLVIGIMAGLISKMKGEGLENPIDISLFATSAALQAQQWQEYLITQKTPKRDGNRNSVLAPAGLYETKDNKYLTIAILREEHWDKFCRSLELDFLLKNPDFKTNVLRLQNRDELEKHLIPLFKSYTQEYWIKFLKEKDILVAPVNNLNEIHEDPLLMSSIPFIKLPQNYLSTKYEIGGDIAVGMAINFNESGGGQARFGPAAKGEHTKDILSELGYEDLEITRLEREKKVLILKEQLQ